MCSPVLSLALALLAVAPLAPQQEKIPAADCQAPEISFQEPSTSPGRKVAFTFDDGPDGDRGETDHLLEVLRRLHLKATFFVCADNWVNVASSQSAKATIRQIVADGHELGNHSSHHDHLPALTPSQVFKEFASTQDVVLSHDVLGTGHAPLTLLRAPYGQPFEADEVNTAWVAPILARLGVHIGWNINSYDWACKNTACVVDNVMRAIDAGKDGTILMHSNYRWTADAMPVLLERMRSRGIEVVTVEQLLVEKYGKNSASLHKQYLHACKK